MCGFRRILKGHNYFHSTPFSDKINEQIFQKSPKTLISGHFLHFWSFLPEGDFSKKKQTLSRSYPYGPLTPYKDSEKTNKPIPRKLLERNTEGRTDPIS